MRLEVLLARIFERAVLGLGVGVLARREPRFDVRAPVRTVIVAIVSTSAAGGGRASFGVAVPSGAIALLRSAETRHTCAKSAPSAISGVDSGLAFPTLNRAELPIFIAPGELAPRAGVEPTTYRLGGGCSIH